MTVCMIAAICKTDVGAYSRGYICYCNFAGQGRIQEFFKGGGGGGSGPEFFEGKVWVQVRGNFHILTSKKKKNPSEGGGGGGGGLTPPLDPLLLGTGSIVPLQF